MGTQCCMDVGTDTPAGLSTWLCLSCELLLLPLMAGDAEPGPRSTTPATATQWAQDWQLAQGSRGPPRECRIGTRRKRTLGHSLQRWQRGCPPQGLQEWGNQMGRNGKEAPRVDMHTGAKMWTAEGSRERSTVLVAPTSLSTVRHLEFRR